MIWTTCLGSKAANIYHHVHLGYQPSPWSLSGNQSTAMVMQRALVDRNARCACAMWYAHPVAMQVLGAVCRVR